MNLIKRSLLINKVVLPIVSNYLELSDQEYDKIYLMVSALRMSFEQFCWIVCLCKRFGQTTFEFEEMFLGCFLIVNEFQEQSVPKRYISNALQLNCQDLVDLEMGILTSLDSLRPDKYLYARLCDIVINAIACCDLDSI